MFQNGQFSQDGTYLQSDDPQLDSEDDPLVAAEGSPADDSPSSIENATEENGLDSEIVGSGEDDQNGEKNSADIAYPAKKAQPVLDDALELCRVSQDFWQKGELENALDALDQAYALILHVDSADQPKLIQQKEDLRFLISKRILEIYASRNIVVNGNHNAIPLVMNSHIQKEINLFTRGERNFFRSSYKRSGRYRPMIVAALREAGLPEELSWLPLIESGFKVNALSRSRALGPWQFIPSTGYKFGLKRDKFTDERMDPAKSTRAAIAYLKELHGIFGDWSTVLAAYNCGEGRVLRVIRSQNLNYLDNFWDLYERLPRETARYVPRFLATLHILNNPEKYGIDDIVVDPPLESERVTISKQVHLRDVARTIGVSEAKLKELNPELRYKIVPGDGYPLRVPLGHSNILLANLDKIPVTNPPQRAFVYHRVRRGETLSVIARKYRTSVGSLMRANKLRRSNYIVAG
ncbi:MAG: transglycosylase SLT domain-containing protein, partial [Deltaproteobacteria bacterium]|nr:transglycosylase SLT domain-containing protein [Deltaproteobacteria bacterium]